MREMMCIHLLHWPRRLVGEYMHGGNCNRWLCLVIVAGKQKRYLMRFRHPLPY